MSSSCALLALSNLAFIGLLPKLFFRKDGTLNARWLLTAFPFFFAPVLVALAAFGALSPLSFGLPHEQPVREGIAVLLFVASIALMGFTLGAHRVPLSLWHQDNDDPVHVVTHGPYAVVRHPFYASFLLGLLGVLVALPGMGTLLCFAVALLLLDVTARREERRLLASPFGDEYRAYMRRAGRFAPRLFGRAPGEAR